MQGHDVHVRSLAKATAITGYMVKDAIPPLEVIRVLNAAGIQFMLVGAYGLGGWMKAPRATEDVDIIVATRHYKKSIRALLAAFPGLELDDQPAVARLRDKETHDVAIDVIKPFQDLFKVALKHTHPVVAEDQAYKVPSLEMALAMKFAAMISPSRSDEKKYLDAHDFIRMVKANAEIDLAGLAELGEHVYPGGGKKAVEKVQDVRTGKKLNV